MAFFQRELRPATSRAVKYAIVGTGSRHAMYREALAEHADRPVHELVALCDVNPRRLELAASRSPDQVAGSASACTPPTSSIG